jgi:hypothetical protein
MERGVMQPGRHVAPAEQVLSFEASAEHYREVSRQVREVLDSLGVSPTCRVFYHRYGCGLDRILCRFEARTRENLIAELTDRWQFKGLSRGVLEAIAARLMAEATKFPPVE